MLRAQLPTYVASGLARNQMIGDMEGHYYKAVNVISKSLQCDSKVESMIADGSKCVTSVTF